MAKLVNKQFNTPIGLYSQQNIQDVLDREAQILANGAVGIDFRNPDVGKPDNLKNSAVLRMLEEEESRQRNGYGSGVKRVAWPPPLEIGQDSPYIEQNSVQGQGQRQASRPVEPPPTTITLRPQAPVSQAPPPVYTSQPATANLKGGKHLRGDLKWPPEEVKMQAEEENRLRLELAKGPVCRPRKVKKDYTSFFEQHALNSTYPGYKIPPGTQFYKPE
ncbi:unnamed protein product [Psylliodes chrysocephalus]|uniref:Zasp-like motif domain-containing protein n=1 Tax=Psylliodes chrysocephalus TaxID=3402493 RepID=A0A9P0D773_9CUCU|nr:unnamed protein product [Psylliodes chrysocephala]